MSKEKTSPMAKQHPDTINVKTKNVFCDGTNNGTLNPVMGHPGVYLKIEHTFVECTYCGKRFVFQGKNESDH